MVVHPFELAPIAEQIWREKYQFRCDGRERLGCADAVAADRTGTEARAHPESDASMADTWRRVAVAAASVETTETARRNWAEQFDAAMRSFVFIPGGRIIAGAGTGRRVTLFNCFVMGDMPDDLGSIFDSLKDAALTMQQGGGIGQDFSTLRPKGAPLSATGATASGPLSFMDVWNTMCGTIMSAGARRGAMMATLRCDHPDLLDFIEAKTTRGRLTNFNLSVLVTDAFVEAVRADRDWPLVFNGETYAVHKARSIWDRIMRATYDSAEPGVIFIDRVNALNNLAHCETIAATNPCGEQPLPAFGACLLGSINLTQLVNDPFSDGAHLDLDRLDEHVRTAVRLLDNIIDVSGYPLAAQRAEALAKRRIGLGVTGLANALAMCGIAYGTPLAAERMGTWLARLKAAAYDASADIAAEKGPFPLFDADAMLAAPNLLTLPDTVRAKIATHGLRNGCLTTIAPTGTTSLIAGNVSSGIEPTFAPRYRRSVLGDDGETRDMIVEDYAVALHRHITGRALPDALAGGIAHLAPGDHIRMQQAAQPHIDSAISKTINCPEGISFDDFAAVYLECHASGLKGCTTYRPSPARGAVLSVVEPAAAQPAEASPKPAHKDDAAPHREAQPRHGDDGARLPRATHGPDDHPRAQVAHRRVGGLAAPAAVYVAAPIANAEPTAGAGAGAASDTDAAAICDRAPVTIPCPDCGGPERVFQEGCWVCQACGSGACS